MEEPNKDPAATAASNDKYKDSLNLPQTDFPMRGQLPTQEPLQIQKWLDTDLYSQMVQRNKGKTPFLLHDGPPYANGDIHIGHALNKVLKDVVIKYRNMAGFYSPYIPGWDCHGLPIELAVEKELIKEKKNKADLSVLELRKRCRTYAEKFIQIQLKQFQRLEVFGDWSALYRTMDFEYTGSIVQELGKCLKNGFLYRGNKVVSWCTSCKTALADAEIEYAEKKSPSITVAFNLRHDSLAKFPDLEKAARSFGADKVSILIWTTTPWTLPANRGIALHPEFEYSAIGVQRTEGAKKEVWIIARELKDALLKSVQPAASQELLKFKAQALHKLEAEHPFIAGQKSLVLLGEHVTADAGTGAVHTAPGHGVEDYKIGLRYSLEVFSPVDARGCYTADFSAMQGVFALKANEPIIDGLKNSGHLILRQDITHSYPHCWRCHEPVIFRATPQWFISVEEDLANGRSLRREALAATKTVNWVPSWGINRILGMLESRPDWCVSRQRYWGVPLTVFYCEACDFEVAKPELFEKLAARIRKDGPDIWYEEPAEKLLGEKFKCTKCGSSKLRKETDILDVWFDSGVSHAAVCEARGLGWPADLYLEGSDQHRGWFQTSMLTSVATRGSAPFKSVLTHGFVNDKEGKKMSKSKGNVTSPLDLMKTHGAEIVRLWVVLEDYRSDVNFSKESLDRVSETYRKIRNTLRFILSNLYDFNPNNLSPTEDLSPLDRWALASVGKSIEKIRDAYEAYEFHTVYHETMNLFSVELSSIYFDVLKDRLYTAGKNSVRRRASQTALWKIGSALLRALAPIISYTTEEAWGYLPHKNSQKNSIFLNDFPTKAETKSWEDPILLETFAKIFVIRDQVMKSLEEARRAKVLGHPREAKVKLGLPPDSLSLLDAFKKSEPLSKLFLVSELEIFQAGKVTVEILASTGQKCPRCWTYSHDLGSVSRFPEVCGNCVEALTV